MAVLLSNMETIELDTVVENVGSGGVPEALVEVADAVRQDFVAPHCAGHLALFLVRVSTSTNSCSMFASLGRFRHTLIWKVSFLRSEIDFGFYGKAGTGPYLAVGLRAAAQQRIGVRNIHNYYCNA